MLSLANAGTIWLDVVSLFPAATFNNRTNGLRADLANMLVGLHPSFLRFPGGNFIEGDNLTNAVRWKKTIGEISQRPGHLNDAWGYWSTDGFGLHGVSAILRGHGHAAALRHQLRTGARFRWQHQQHRARFVDGAVGAGRPGRHPVCQWSPPTPRGARCGPPTAIPRRSTCNTWKLATKTAASITARITRCFTARSSPITRPCT